MVAEDIANCKILIVEDDPDNLHLLSLYLETVGFTDVIGTSESKNVLELVEQRMPDLILLDLHMPGVDGFEVMDRIGRAVPGHKIPMIVMSGDVTTEVRQTGEQIGATDFLGKPFEMKTLLSTVERALSPGEASRTS